MLPRTLPFLFLICLFYQACTSSEEKSKSANWEQPRDCMMVPLPPETVAAVQPAPPLSPFERTFIDSGLVDVQTLDSTLRVKLMYSTPDNFVGIDVYGTLTRCYLRPEAAEKLVRAQEILHETHPDHHLILFDCCRPRRVQQKMWDSLDIPFKRNYLAPPWEGSVHNYGCAVDLSIVGPDGEELDMGTLFDFFGPKAQPQQEQLLLSRGELTEVQVDNRLLLRKTLRRAGFWNIQTEWWHFNAFLTPEVKRRFGVIE